MQAVPAVTQAMTTKESQKKTESRDTRKTPGKGRRTKSEQMIEMTAIDQKRRKSRKMTDETTENTAADPEKKKDPEMKSATEVEADPETEEDKFPQIFILNLFLPILIK